MTVAGVLDQSTRVASDGPPAPDMGLALHELSLNDQILNSNAVLHG